MFAESHNLRLAKQPIEGENIYLRMAEKRDYMRWQTARQAGQDFFKLYEPTWHKDVLSKKYFYARVKNDKHAASADVKYGFLIFHKTDNRLLGGININNVQRTIFQNCTLGYWTSQAENSKGYMSEAVGLMSNACFNKWGLNRVQAATLTNNKASIRVLEKNGFLQEGVAKQFLKINNQWRDHILFAKIRCN